MMQVLSPFAGRSLPLLCPAILLLSMIGLLGEGFYLEVPYVRQANNYCGPAALATVFRYWKRDADQHQMAARFQPFPSKGLSGAQLKELAVEFGFSAYSFSGEAELVKRHLQKGRPVIIALSTSQFLNLNHYVILVGWDETRRQWVLHDPARGPYRRMSADSLESDWSKLENWTLLLLPQEGD